MQLKFKKFNIFTNFQVERVLRFVTGYVLISKLLQSFDLNHGRDVTL